MDEAQIEIIDKTSLNVLIQESNDIIAIIVSSIKTSRKRK